VHALSPVASHGPELHHEAARIDAQAVMGD